MACTNHFQLSYTRGTISKRNSSNTTSSVQRDTANTVVRVVVQLLEILCDIVFPSCNVTRDREIHRAGNFRSSPRRPRRFLAK